MSPFENVNIVIFIVLLTLYFLYLKRLTKHKNRYLKWHLINQVLYARELHLKVKDEKL